MAGNSDKKMAALVQLPRSTRVGWHQSTKALYIKVNHPMLSWPFYDPYQNEMSIKGTLKVFFCFISDQASRDFLYVWPVFISLYDSP